MPSHRSDDPSRAFDGPSKGWMVISDFGAADPVGGAPEPAGATTEPTESTITPTESAVAPAEIVFAPAGSIVAPAGIVVAPAESTAAPAGIVFEPVESIVDSGISGRARAGGVRGKPLCRGDNAGGRSTLCRPTPSLTVGLHVGRNFPRPRRLPPPPFPLAHGHPASHALMKSKMSCTPTPSRPLKSVRGSRVNQALR